MEKSFVIGIDFGSNSVRALLVDAHTGEEFGCAGAGYPGGAQGIYLDPARPLLARQSPGGVLEAMRECVGAALTQASAQPQFDRSRVVGIGVDGTASSPLPVDERLRPLAFDPRFEANLNAWCWMWKDHCAMAEAREITELARERHPEYLSRCGGSYSPEWYWAKILHCLRIDPAVFHAAYAWLELPDFIPVALGKIDRFDAFHPGVCAAGHKALYCRSWGGYPPVEFFAALDPALGNLRKRMPRGALDPGDVAAHLAPEWAECWGIPAGIPIASGMIDAHAGAVGAGVGEGRMVKILGTSSCDILAVPEHGKIEEIPGICGLVEHSVLPDAVGIEAGQAAVGDIFQWFVRNICNGDGALFARLEAEGARQAPGGHGLLALDWLNGNRNILCDQNLSGLVVGMTLQTTRAELYRALVESAAFGARRIVEQLEKYRVRIDEVICCGGIAAKSPFLMGIYADVLNRKLRVSASEECCALGSAVLAAAAARVQEAVAAAQRAFCRFSATEYTPDPERHRVYMELYELYCRLHDQFGGVSSTAVLGDVMKRLSALARRAGGLHQA